MYGRCCLADKYRELSRRTLEWKFWIPKSEMQKIGHVECALLFCKQWEKFSTRKIGILCHDMATDQNRQIAVYIDIFKCGVRCNR